MDCFYCTSRGIFITVLFLKIYKTDVKVIVHYITDNPFLKKVARKVSTKTFQKAKNHIDQMVYPNGSNNSEKQKTHGKVSSRTVFRVVLIYIKNMFICSCLDE